MFVFADFEIAVEMLSATQVRQAQGYEHIRVVCTKKNWEVVQNLYDFTQDAMKLAATGRVEDLATWTSADYRVEYLELVSSTRPMVHRTMGVVDLSRVQCIQQPMPAAAAAAPASKRRSEGMSRCYACTAFNASLH